MSTAQPVIEQFRETPVQFQTDEVKPGAGQIRLPYVSGPERQVADYIDLGALRHPALRVIVPLRVSFAMEDGSACAHAEEIDEFGFGASYGAALVDLQHTIAELYFTLEEDQGRLGPDLARVWSVLQAKIRRRNAPSAA